MIELIDALLLKNRTFVSSDMRDCMALIAREIPLTLHHYASGRDFGTWIVPQQWDVRKAVLSDDEGVIASYEQHPLFVAPYSRSFTGWVSREELLQHVQSVPDKPDVFFYEHRLASDHRRRLKEWIITIPHSVLQRMTKPRYHVDLQFEIADGELLVGESTINGRHGSVFALLTHLCHPGQANDGLAGVAVGVEVMKRIRETHVQPQYSYQLLVMPETIGSAIHLSANERTIETYLGAVFIEMAGIRSPLRLGHTRRGDTYLDRVLKFVMTERGREFLECAFMEQWGNDELMFDSPGVGIPGASLERYPYEWYHTSGDSLSETDEASLEEIVQILMDVVSILEADFIPVPRQRVPVYLTRYDLYADWVWDRKEYDLNSGILAAFWSGMSVFDIALSLRAPYERVREYVQRFVEHGLVDRSPLTPRYFRHGPAPLAD